MHNSPIPLSVGATRLPPRPARSATTTASITTAAPCTTHTAMPFRRALFIDQDEYIASTVWPAVQQKLQAHHQQGRAP